MSQFTLYHTLNGNKPNFNDAMANAGAKELYNLFLGKLEGEYLKMQKALKEKPAEEEKKRYVQPGAFGQYMNIAMTADGPVTLVVESVRDPKAVKKFEQTKERQAKIEANR